MKGGGEFLASFCLTRENDTVSAEVADIADLAERCAARLRFFEIVYVVPERDRGDMETSAALLSRIANLRILYVRNDISMYRQRRIGAAEAIGDVVVLTAMRELVDLDLPAFAEEAFHANEIRLARRTGKNGRSIFYPLLNLLTEHRISSRDMRTIALPRTRLVQILARETATIDLRFEPNRGDRYVRVPVAHRSSRFRGQRHHWELLTEIISNASTRYLRIYAFLSLIAAAAAMAYVVYTIVVYLTFSQVAPGWFTTNFTQGSFLTLLALGFCIFSLGLARLTEQKDNGVSLGIVDEVGNINFFHSTQDLNVELGRTDDPALPLSSRQDP